MTWKAGGYAWLPAGRVRARSRSDGGCLAFAWFSGAPGWRQGRSQTVPAGEVVHRHWREAPRRRLPLGSEGWLLRYGPEHATWVVEAPAASAVAAETEWLSLTDLAWAVVPAGEPVAPLPGPCLCRLRHREETP